MEEFLTIAGAATSEFTEKKSRFVSDIFPVQTENIIGNWKKQSVL